MRDDQAEASRLMDDFAARTGLASAAPSQRYLWTDAFAVINLLELHRSTGEARYVELANALIDDVHGTLGRHRADAPHSGWLSGLADDEGARHPTRGGLRIGKPLPERAPGEPFDEGLEWNRDGKYFHYLTKWIDALSRAALILDQPERQRQAVELAVAILPRFLLRSSGGQPVGLSWKMSTDLSRPLVDGMNPHDALDGYVSWRAIDRGDAELRGGIEVLRDLSSGRRWGTADPLGLGGLLMDAFRLAQLPDRTDFDQQLVGEVLAGADLGLVHYLRSGWLEAPASQRLAFRELGLAIGLQGLQAIADVVGGSPSAEAVVPHVLSLSGNARVGVQIIDSWRAPENRAVATWTGHRDINEVMLATALLGSFAGTAAASAS